jgi:DNA-binding NarL/FixJ family response regulator
VQRRHQAARTAFEEALLVGEGAVSALERALTHAAYGRFLRRRGEKRAAVTQLQAARAQLLAMGATPFLRRCDDELAACGVSPTEPAGTTNEVPLTPQEQMVAGLACRGLTNPEIARHLVLSVKTVSYHLANVYTKLDIHSRTQLASTWHGAS